MKPIAVIACCSVIALFALLTACQPENLATETSSCLECHSGDTTEGNVVLAAQAQYDNSGHLNGPRMLDPYEASTGHLYVFHGSNAMYTNGSNCSKCHSHQGFVDFVAAGMPASWNQAYGAASPPGCFTCHKPHVSGDFSLRKESGETLVDTTTVFNWGAGNLCVTCHKSLTRVGRTDLVSSTAFFNTTTTFPKNWTSSNGPHHGPQADFMLGKNSAPITGKTYVGNSDHLRAGLPDSCVSCHMYQPAARLSGSLQLGGHGMYLGGDVHGADSNVIGACRSCHTYPVTGTGGAILIQPTSAGSGSLTGGFETALSPDLNVNDRLADIRANRDLLIAYFGTGTNFLKTVTPFDPGAAGDGPIESPSGGDVASGEWGRDWVFAGSRLTETQSYAFWNFKLFIEDKSQGIHNPVYAHQILFDSVEALGLTPVGTRP